MARTVRDVDFVDGVRTLKTSHELLLSSSGL
jgi:hypothetical protein